MRLLERLLGPMIDRRIAAYQKDLITKQCEEVETMYRTMRGWRHDYHNQIQMLKALLHEVRQSEMKMEALDRMDVYLTQLNEDLIAVDTVIKTGNVMVDAILNSKLSVIRSKKIPITAKAVVPQVLSVAEVDLCVIIGNLLDNAMEACLSQSESEERFIRVYIGILKEQLYISVYNSTYGERKKNKRAYKKSYAPNIIQHNRRGDRRII